MASKDVATLIGHLVPLNHTANAIGYTPTLPLTATDVQSAIDQLLSLGSVNNAFGIIAAPSGGNVVADSTSDTWTITSSDKFLSIVNTPGTDTTDFTKGSAFDEFVDDRVAVLIQNGTGISWTYVDGSGTLTGNLTNTGVIATTYGTATQVGQFAVDAQGRITSAANIAISITSAAITDFNEAAQDAVGGILTDTASIDFTYNDAGNIISAVVLPAGVDHNSLANLTTGDPHTQYILDPGTVTDNAIVRWDTTSGRAVQDSLVLISDGGAITGAVSATIGTPNTITISSGQIQAAGNLVINTSLVTGNIDLNPGNSGDLRSNQIQNQGIIYGATSGSSVAFTTDNTALVYDQSSIVMSIGWPTFSYVLEGSTKGARLLNQASDPAGAVATFAQVVASSTASIGPVQDMVRARGNLSTPTVITAADQLLGSIRGCGHDGTDYNRAAAIEFYSDGAFSGSSAPGKISFWTTKSGGTALGERLRIGNDGTLTFVTSGATITNDSGIAVGSGFTRWDVDNLRLDANTVSSVSGDLNLSASSTVVSVGTNSLNFGSTNQAGIAYSTNLIINPAQSGTGIVFIGDGTTPDGIQAESIGLGDTSSLVSAVRIININANTSGFSNGMFCSMVYSGTTVTARAMNMTLTHAGGSATTAAVVNVFTATHTVEPSGTVTLEGFRGIGSAGVVSSTGTKIYRGVVGAPAISTGHTGGTIRSMGIYAVATTGAAGSATWTDWGMLSEGDVQLNTDLKLYLEGSSTAKGDSYFTFNNSTTEIEVYVDAVLTHCFDNDESRCETKLSTKAGTSTAYAKVSGVINVDTTAVGNVGTGEDDLISYTVPANVLATNGDSIRFKMAGTFAANANNKRIKVKYGATTLLDTTALAFNGADWEVDGMVVRTGAATQKAICNFRSASALLTTTTDYTTPAETLSGAVVLKCTGEATSNNDIVEEFNIVEWLPQE